MRGVRIRLSDGSVVYLHELFSELNLRPGRAVAVLRGLQQGWFKRRSGSGYWPTERSRGWLTMGELRGHVDGSWGCRQGEEADPFTRSEPSGLPPPNRPPKSQPKSQPDPKQKNRQNQALGEMSHVRAAAAENSSTAIGAQMKRS